MSIEQHLTTMIACGVEREQGFVELPATPAEIASATRHFEQAFGVPLPGAYARILSVANGLVFGDLCVWSTHRSGIAGKSIVDANQELRVQYGHNSVYFGQSNEALFGYDIARELYFARQTTDGTEQAFPDAEPLLEHMLSVALDRAAIVS